MNSRDGPLRLKGSGRIYDAFGDNRPSPHLIPKGSILKA